MRTDALHLFRSLRRSPISAAATIVTLALTIGVGASIFAVTDAILLTPPPFAEPETLVLLGERPVDEPAAVPRPVPYATFESWRRRADTLASLEAFDGTNLTLTGVGDAQRLSATDTTPGFLRLLGVSPTAGRLFNAADVAQPVVIVSHEFWRSTLGFDPAVIGRSLELGGRRHTVVGVLPERFAFGLNRTDLWRPLPIDANEAARTGYRVLTVARLGDRTSPMQLASALDDVSRQSRPPSSAVATPVAAAIVGNRGQTLGLLAGGAALAVLIAFINLAGLLVVRSIDRRRELAVRSALGARRAEIVRQLLFEAVALVACGTVVGVLIASWMTPVVERLALEQFGDAVANRAIAISWRVIGVVAGCAFACALVSGSLPAFQTARRNVVDILRRGVTSSPRDRGLRRLFVGGEVALAFVLLMSMALIGRTLIDLLKVNPGFESRGVLAMQLALPRAVYPRDEQVASFYASLQSTLQDRLGVQSVSVVDELPLTHNRGRVLLSTGAEDAGREAVLRTVHPAYFDVMRIPISAGRGFERQDDLQAPRRIVVSESLAARLFPNERPIGRQVRFGRDAQLVEVIGVVGDVKHVALNEQPFPTVYVSGLQEPSAGSILVVRSSRADADVIAAVRAEVARLDPNLPVYGVRAVEQVVSNSAGMPARRLLTAVFTGFALLAIALSAIGMFGVAAHDVVSRRPELALRLALGANPYRLMRATLGQSAVIVGTGLAAGALLSIWSAQALSGIVVGTARVEMLSGGIAAAVLLVAGAAAVLPAALRAARTDPLLALRSE